MSFEGRRDSEPSALRALGNLLRLQLIELVQQAGLLTATEAAAPADDGPDTVPITWLQSAVPLSQPTSSDACPLRTPQST